MTTILDQTAQLSQMMASLRAAHMAGRTTRLAWRLDQLDAVIRLLDEREDEIAAALLADLGRSPVETWLGDITSSRAEAVFARKHLRKWMKRKKQKLPLNQQPASGWIQYEPLGTVLIIGAWNYPVYLVLAPLIASIAAGNCAVVKPSELAPATSELLASLLPEYLDSDAISVVQGAGDMTQDLLSLGFDHALFTGGSEIGKKIMAGAAETLTPVTLELGGKSPVIVLPDANLDVAARRITWIKLLNSGQTCIAPDYVLVHESVREELVNKIAACISEFGSGSLLPGLRIVNTRQFDRLAQYIEETKGEIVTGGGIDRDTLTIEPTIIADPHPDEPSMCEEIFGPILPIVTVSSADEAIAFVNGRPKPLALYVFTSSRSAGRNLIDRVPAGGAVVNHVALHCLVPALPFGGVGNSGMGAYHGEWGFHTLSHRKSVLAKTSSPDLRFVYPPYTKRAEKLMRRVF